MKTLKWWMVVVLLALLSSGAQAVLPSSLTITGTPLRITADTMGAIQVDRLQGSSYVEQYYSSLHSYLFLDGQRYATGRSSPYFTPVAFSMPTGWSIVNVGDAGESGVRLTQTLTYVNGSMYFTKQWRIENLGSQTFSAVKFLHGGDTYFAGDDSSQGHWDPALHMVYLTNPNPGLTGIMGFYASALSPSDNYYEDNYGSVWTALANGALPDTVRANYHDAGYGLQWNRGTPATGDEAAMTRTTFAPGDVWNITAYEKWTDAGFVQVFAPADQQVVAGTNVILQFTLMNYQGETDTFDVSVEATAGWPAALAGASTIQIPAGSSSNIEVNTTSGVAGSSSIITLTAISQTDTNISNQDSATITVPGGGAFKNVTTSVGLAYSGWTLNRTTGTLFGDMQIANNGALLLTGPFWYAVPITADCRLWRPTGTLTNGTPYVDLTASVLAALPGVGNGDLTLNPGESVVVRNIEFYCRNRATPVGFMYSIWADPPQFDANMDGAISDSEVLTAVDAWKAGTADDLSLFETIRIWKQAGGQ